MKQLLFIIFLFAVNILFAQQNDKTKKELNLKDIEMPTSPGFILLDQSPTNIERPNSGKALAVSALSSFTESNGLPQNYAVEFTPFWFFKHPNMNVLKYLGYKDKIQRPFSSLKMVTLSLAYVNQTDTVSQTPINNISVGARTNIIKIRSKNNLDEIEKANTKAVAALRNINNEIVKLIGPFDPIDPAGYKIKQEHLLSTLQDSLNNNLSEASLQKPIFAIDFAIAYSTFFTNNDYSTKKFGRFGTWITLNHAEKLSSDNSSYLNLYAIGRYLRDGTYKDDVGDFYLQTFFDFGGKIEFELNKFSIAYEYIQRSNNSIKTSRSTGQIKYKISDNLLLIGAFGENFGNNNNLVSMLGLNFGILSGNEKATIED